MHSRFLKFAGTSGQSPFTTRACGLFGQGRCFFTLYPLFLGRSRDANVRLEIAPNCGHRVVISPVAHRLENLIIHGPYSYHTSDVLKLHFPRLRSLELSIARDHHPTPISYINLSIDAPVLTHLHAEYALLTVPSPHLLTDLSITLPVVGVEIELKLLDALAAFSTLKRLKLTVRKSELPLRMHLETAYFLSVVYFTLRNDGNCGGVPLMDIARFPNVDTLCVDIQTGRFLHGTPPQTMKSIFPAPECYLRLEILNLDLTAASTLR